jgi:tryptophanyl-tRNA synthetase
MSRIFSGVQPTGNLHLGNYLGAIRNFVRLQDGNECIYCVVDLHAITVWQEPDELRRSIREVTAAFIACGVDPQRSVIFNQSQVPAHAELAWIFNCISRLGWLNRMTQFKEKAGKNRENASVGLYAYPNLMAADILAYKATHVPVGEDQKQHLELTRDIAQKFNTDFGRDVFPLVEPVILPDAARVMSLRDGRVKMSKSDPSDQSRINLSDSADSIAHKIRRARTDPNPVPDGSKEGGTRTERPEAFNLLDIFAALAGRPLAQVQREYGGKPFLVFKEALTALAVDKIAPIGEELRRLRDDPGHVDRVLREGIVRARELSEPVIREVHDVVGLLRP